MGYYKNKQIEKDDKLKKMRAKHNWNKPDPVISDKENKGEEIPK